IFMLVRISRSVMNSHLKKNRCSEKTSSVVSLLIFRKSSISIINIRKHRRIAEQDTAHNERRLSPDEDASFTRKGSSYSSNSVQINTELDKTDQKLFFFFFIKIEHKHQARH